MTLDLDILLVAVETVGYVLEAVSGGLHDVAELGHSGFGNETGCWWVGRKVPGWETLGPGPRLEGTGMRGQLPALQYHPWFLKTLISQILEV